VHIDPYAWLLTIPLAVAVLRLPRVPGWDQVVRMLEAARLQEELGWRKVMGTAPPPTPAQLVGGIKRLRWTISGVLAACSIASFWTFVAL
jgi:hypothetical protein